MRWCTLIITELTVCTACVLLDSVWNSQQAVSGTVLTDWLVVVVKSSAVQSAFAAKRINWENREKSGSVSLLLTYIMNLDRGT